MAYFMLSNIYKRESGEADASGKFDMMTRGAVIGQGMGHDKGMGKEESRCLKIF